MTEFGPDGAVVGTSAPASRDYASHEKPKIRRVLLGVFLCGIAASISVALIAAVIAFTFSSVMSIAGTQPDRMAADGGFMTGAFMAVMMSAFNWYVFYIVVPVTWIALAFSIGLFPRRGIVRPGPYYRWGGIWGALLVGGTTGVFGALMQSGSGFGALLTGLTIGGLAGIICAALFLAIVRPQQQVADVAAEVF